MRCLGLARAAVLPALSVLPGCYWLAHYDDLTSGDGASAGDAAPGDGGHVVDATTDQTNGDAVSSETGPFCPDDAGPLVYCQDFDTVDGTAALGLGQGQAKAALETAFWVSPPRALSVVLYGKGGFGAFDYHFPLQPPRTVTLQFDLSYPVLGQWTTLSSIVVVDPSDGTNRVLNVVISSQGGFQMQEYFALPDGGNEQNAMNTVDLDGGADAGAWHHVVLSLTADDGANQYLGGLTVDGQVIEPLQPLGLTWRQGDTHLSVGVTYGGGAGPQFYFDNVRADFGL